MKKPSIEYRSQQLGRQLEQYIWSAISAPPKIKSVRPYCLIMDNCQGELTPLGWIVSNRARHY